MAKALDELNRIYQRAEEVDREVFAEMRSNILLVAGDHYSKAPASRSRTASGSKETKLRLTKNHCHRVSRTYVSALLAEAPTVQILPKHDTEIQDQKDAELNKAVWQDVVDRHDIFPGKRLRWAKSFVDVGEICVKIFWDPMAGSFKGYDVMRDEAGEPLMQETGEMEYVPHPMDPTGQTQIPQPVMTTIEDPSSPLFSGDFVFESVYPFDLLREEGAKEMSEQGRCWIVRKMISTKELKARYKNDEKKLEGITKSEDKTYVIFNSNKGAYETSKEQVMLREFYWPVCAEYPKGHYCYALEAVILEEGELPGGLWPFIWEGFDQYEKTPRGRSIIKVARPVQAEINRASSATATAQVTLGDDKVLYQVGTKLNQGALLPGVRGIAYQGQTPTILPGRDGSQYQGYIDKQVEELDMITMIREMQSSQSGQVDPYAMLYQIASRKQKYLIYTEKFERFLCNVARLTLRLAKLYLPDDALIMAVGRREQVNIPEFRKTSELSTQIKVEPGTEVLEQMFGKQLTLQHILQYVGKDLDQKTLGKLLQQLPFGNLKEVFDDLTIDETIAKNEFLALERGEQVQASPYTDPVYMLKKIADRMKKPEFAYLDQAIKGNYEALKVQYEEINAANEAKMIAAKNEYVPVDGPLITCQLYVQDPSNPDNQPKLARLPERALEWLMQRLEEQGASLEKLEGMNATVLAETAEKMLQGMGRGNAQPQLMAR